MVTEAPGASDYWVDLPLLMEFELEGEVPVCVGMIESRQHVAALMREAGERANEVTHSLRLLWRAGNDPVRQGISAQSQRLNTIMEALRERCETLDPQS